MRRQAGLVTDISVFPTKILIIRLEISPYEQVIAVTGMRKFKYSMQVFLSKESKVRNI